jgi:DNA integrity scanning protein DisA with diadenylate cyclase activity
MQRWNNAYYTVQGIIIGAFLVLMNEYREFKLQIILWYIAATITWYLIHAVGSCWLQVRDFEKHIKPRIKDINGGH